MDAAISNEDVTPVDILHPEVLSADTLVNILKARHIKLDDASRTDKGFLVDLFHRTVTPLPQRVPRGNRRGVWVKKLIKRLDANKPKPEKIAVMEKVAKSTSTKSKGGLRISADIDPGTSSRLKPPPIVIKNKNKVVRLGGGLSEPTSNSVNKNMTSIRTSLTKIKLSSSANQNVAIVTETSNSSKGEKSPTKLKRTPITFNSGEKSTSVKTVTDKSKVLIRTTSSSDVTQKPGENIEQRKKLFRTPIRYNDTKESGTDPPVSPKPKVAAEGKDAVLRALYGSSRSPERMAVKRPAVRPEEVGKDGGEDEGRNHKKKKKITWP